MINKDKMMAYAMAYLELKIKEHSDFLADKENKQDYVQYYKIIKYKNELDELKTCLYYLDNCLTL